MGWYIIVVFRVSFWASPVSFPAEPESSALILTAPLEFSMPQRNQFLRAWLFLFVLTSLLIGLVGTVKVPANAAPQFAPSTTVVISQVYGGGGNANATYTNDFVELFNLSTSGSVSLSGWSIQYASAAGNTWAVTNLSGSLAAGQYYLVQLGSGGAVGSPLPTPDITDTTNMAAGAGKVALVNTTTALSGTCPTGGSIIDFIGYGTTASCSETANAPAPSNTTADIRGSNGCTDNDNNSSDFTAGTPTPRNTSSIGYICGVGTYTPTNTATNTSTPTASPIEVVINEVAWAGTAASSDDQWIELYNPGATVDISGWRLVSASGSLDITFPNGTIINA